MSGFAPKDGEMIPPEIEDRVRSEMAASEHLVWSAQPDTGRAMLMSLPLVLFGIPFTGFACVWATLATGLGGLVGWNMPGHGGGFGALGALFGLFGLPFMLVGLGLLLSPIWAVRMARRTCYALTDRRVITWTANPFGSVRVRSFTPQALGRISRNERPDGSGDLIFDEYATRDNEGRRRVVSVGFMGIRDVRAVEELLRKTLNLS